MPIKKVWAFIQQLRGYQQTAAQRLSSETTYKILTRYHREINQVLDIEERHAYMEITATWKGERWDE